MWKDPIIVQHDQPTPVEGEYQSPRRALDSGRARGAGAILVGLGLLFAKLKALLFFLLNFKVVFIGLKVLASAGTFLLSLWFYTIFFGFPFALVFLLQLLVHELGHVGMMRVYGVPGSLPFFIPGFGALVNMQGRPASAVHESYIALAGPVAGAAAATVCFLYGQATGHTFWIAAAYTGFFLNLFNLMPVMPLDGGRVVGAISPRIWLFGLVLFVVAVIAFHWWNPLILILLLMSIPQAIAAWHGTNDPMYYQVSPAQRVSILVAYFSLVVYLMLAMLASHVVVPAAR